MPNKEKRNMGNRFYWTSVAVYTTAIIAYGQWRYESVPPWSFWIVSWTIGILLLLAIAIWALPRNQYRKDEEKEN